MTAQANFLYFLLSLEEKSEKNSFNFFPPPGPAHSVISPLLLLMCHSVLTIRHPRAHMHTHRPTFIFIGCYVVMTISYLYIKFFVKLHVGLHYDMRVTQ